MLLGAPVALITHTMQISNLIGNYLLHYLLYLKLVTKLNNFILVSYSHHNIIIMA